MFNIEEMYCFDGEVCKSLISPKVLQNAYECLGIKPISPDYDFSKISNNYN